jgi:hypothetical protein
MRRSAWLLLAPALLGAAEPSGSGRIAVRPEQIQAHTEFLADDLLEGREAGTRGDRLAQLYLAKQMAAIGLAPAGDEGSYLQSFRVRATQLEAGSAALRITSGGSTRAFENGADVAVFADPVEPDQRIEAAVVFAGYGIVAPEHGIDDYRGLDVRGKIVAVLGGPPAFLPAADAAHFGSTDQQRTSAEKRGAIGVVVLWTPALEQRFVFDGLRPLLARTELNWIGRDGRVSIGAPGIRARAFLRGSATDALLVGSGLSFARLMETAKTRSPRGRALRSTLSLSRRSRHRDDLVTANVAGLLPGSDPAMAGEPVLVTAHYDHVGIGAPVNGDAIYNGALDNAIGTAMLLEVARRLKAAPERPRRPILFLAVGAEEKGLIGSDYHAEHGGSRAIANINIDGAMPFYDFSDVIAFGAEQSQMGERLKAAAGELGLTVALDPFLEEGIFTRSDQYSYVKRGVPALFLYMGFTDMAGRKVGRAVWDRTAREITHMPADDLAQPIDYRVAAKFADVFRRVILVTADHPERPLWYGGSVFGQRFAPTQAKAPRP